MIRIHQPAIIKKAEGRVRISCEIESKNEIKELWYEFPEEVKEYLLVERLDAFLVGVLFLALKKGENIELKAPVSQKLYYNLSHYLIDALCLANPNFSRIKIFFSTLDNTDYNKGNVSATGMSCGVDSFATFFDHVDETPPFKIEYLTFFNVGSHGDFGGALSDNIFTERFNRARIFSKRTGVPILKIDSNISEVLKMNFLQTNTLRNISAILHLQKLFKNYYLASKNRFDKFLLNSFDNQDYDTLTLNLLSTESINLYSAVSNMQRSEKTLFISRFQETYDSLDVCVNPKHGAEKINCSECFKCLRTLLTLDIYNKAILYEEVFDLEKYYRNKDFFIGEIIAKRKESFFNEDLYRLLKVRGQISFVHKINSKKYKVEKRLKCIKKKLKKIIQ